MISSLISAGREKYLNVLRRGHWGIAGINFGSPGMSVSKFGRWSM